MRDDRQSMLVRFIDDGLHFFHRHLILIDELYAVDTRVRQLADFLASISRAIRAPAKIFGSWIRLVLNERTRNVKCRPGNLSRIDSIANRYRLFERCAEV